MKTPALALAIIAVASGHAAAHPLDKVTFFTEQFAPFNYEDDGTLKGISVAIAEAVLKAAGSTTRREDFRLVPWRRAYRLTRTMPNTAVFATARTARREPRFTWVGPFAPSNMVVMGRRDLANPPAAVRDLNAFFTAAITDDAGHELLLDAGVDAQRIIDTTKKANIVRLLASGRVQFWTYNETAAKYTLKQHGMRESFRTYFTLKEGKSYFAFNPDTNPAAIEAFREAFRRLKAAGRIAEIRGKFVD